MNIQYITYEDECYKGYEIYELTDGTGQISLRGDSFESAILFEGNPIAFHWSDCQGSIGQYLVRATKYEDYQSSLEIIRKTVNDEISDLPLSSALHGILSLFESGQYLLKEFELSDFDYFEPGPAHFSYYPFERVLIGTQPKTFLVEDMINKHIKRIEDGYKPKLIVASVMENGETMYLLDGHHKLEAYKRLNIQPNIIQIVSVTAQPLNLEEGIAYVSLDKSKKLYSDIKNSYHKKIKSNNFKIALDESKKLFDAIFDNDITLVKEILDNNRELVESYNCYGLPALHYATQIRHNDIIKSIINYSVDINSRDQHDKAAIHYAIMDEHIETLKLLVSLGASINIQAGRTNKLPLDSAISWGYIKNALIQIELGADPALSTQDLIFKASSRRNGLSLVKILVENFGFKPTKDHQKNIMQPQLREYVNNCLLEQEGEGANIIYNKIAVKYKKIIWSLLQINNPDSIDKNKSGVIKIKTVVNNSKIIDSFPIVPIFNETKVDIRNIKHWKGTNELEAEITVANEEGFMFDFFPVDYAQNKNQYGKGGTQSICFSAIAENIKLPMQAEEDYVAMFGKVKEKHFHFWSCHDDEYYHVSFMGKILSMKNIVFYSQKLVLLEVKVKLSDNAKYFFTLPVLVHSKNIKVKNIGIDSLIEGSVFIHGKIKE